MSAHIKTWRATVFGMLMLAAPSLAQAVEASDDACPDNVAPNQRFAWAMQTLNEGTDVRAMRAAVRCGATLGQRPDLVKVVVDHLRRPPDAGQGHQWQMFLEAAASLIQDAPLDDASVTDVLIALSNEPEPHFAAIWALAHRGQRGIAQLAVLIERHPWRPEEVSTTNCRECLPSEATFAAMLRADPNHPTVIEVARARLRGSDPARDARRLFDLQPGTANTLIRELTPEFVRLRDTGPSQEIWASLLINHNLTPDLAPVPLGYLRRDRAARGDLAGAIVETPGGPVRGRFVLTEAGYVAVTLVDKTHDVTQEIVGSGILYDDRVYLKYYERQGDFVRVLSYDGLQPSWIELTSLSPPLQAVTWIEDLVERGGSYLLYGYNNYRLRSAPDVDAPALLRLEEETKHVISGFTGNIAGAWAEAVVVEISAGLGGCWNHEDLATAKTGRSWTGWIKVVNDNGLKGDIDHHHGC